MKKKETNKINNSIDTLELMMAMDQLEKENGISKEVLLLKLLKQIYLLLID